MSGRTLRIIAGLAVALCLAGPLAACGKKGAPTAPKDQPNTYPRAYPNDPGTPTAKPDPSSFPSMHDGNTNDDPTRSQE